MKNILKTLVVLCAWLAIAPTVQAQYPSRTIRFIVPFPPGGLADYIARLLGQSLTATLGQQLLVDNRPGADGAVAGVITMKAAPDGYTVFFGTNSPMSAVPALHRNPPYDPIADFTPISLLGRFTFFLFVSPSVPARTLAELIEYARANPGKLNYGTGNTSAIVATAQLKLLAGLNMTQIPYKGDAPTTTDLLGGRIQLAFMATVPGFAQAKDGRLRLLAVLLPQRSAMAPEVPTIAEAGMPGISITPWAGVFGPAKMPRQIVERLSRDFREVVSRAEIRDQLARQGFETQGSTAAELDAYNKDQLKTWARVIREAKITIE
jgi:tripartite-type tricarboxylate transporter receptor subunit TctC